MMSTTAHWELDMWEVVSKFFKYLKDPDINDIWNSEKLTCGSINVTMTPSQWYTLEGQ